MNTFFKFSLLFLLATNFSHCDDTLEKSCLADNDCKSFEDKSIGSSCKSGICHCFIRRPEKGTEAQVKCMPKSSLKILRNGDEEEVCPCTRPNTECNYKTQKCECKKDFMLIKDGRCIASSIILNKHCELHDQCRNHEKFSECDNGTCKCIEHFHQLLNTCRSIANKAKSNCVSSSDCNENEECLADKCICKKEFIASKNPDNEKCLPIAYYGQKCVELYQCSMGLGAGSVCEENECACNANHTRFDNDGKIICQKRILVGDACDDHNDCVPFKGEAMMSCRNNTCNCDDGYELFDAYQKKCIKKAEFLTSAGLIETVHVFCTLFLIFIVSKVLM